MSGVRRDLRGRRALVTGAARRLGRAIALALAESGADLVIHYRESRDDAESLAEEARRMGRQAVCVPGELGRPGGAEDFVAAVRKVVDRLDILVNNVGVFHLEPLDSMRTDLFRETLEANLVAPQVLIRDLTGLFPDRGGHVINIGFAGAQALRPYPQATAYQASKAGLHLLTRSWAQKLAPRGIRVNTVSPGHLENSVELPLEPEKISLLGRAGRLDEVVEALMYLLDPDSWITGTEIEVAGGWLGSQS